MAERVSVLVKFPPELLARIEDHAKASGLNRMAAILALIDRGLMPPPVPEPVAPEPKPSFSQGRSKTVVAPAKRRRTEAPEPFKSRLKGEWKAP